MQNISYKTPSLYPIIEPDSYDEAAKLYRKLHKCTISACDLIAISYTH